MSTAFTFKLCPVKSNGDVVFHNNMFSIAIQVMCIGNNNEK